MMRSPAIRRHGFGQLAWVGVLCLILTACVGPVGANRADPKAVLRDLGRSATTTGEPTWQTRNVLLEQGFLAAFEERPEDVPDSLVRAVALVGSASEAKDRLDAYRRAGAELPIVYPVPCLDPRSSVLGTLFATAPHPALTS